MPRTSSAGRGCPVLGSAEGSGDRDLGVQWFPVTQCSHLFLNPVREEKRNNQNLKSVSDGLDASGKVLLGRGWNCVFRLIGPWAQIPNTKTHPAPSFELVTSSDELSLSL